MINPFLCLYLNQKALEDCGCKYYKYIDVNLDLVVKPILLNKLAKMTGQKAGVSCTLTERPV
jgi:hypothetical protein